jgi:hypothetical protein
MNLIEEMNPRIIELLEQSGFMEIIEDHANEFGSGISDAEYPEFYKFVEMLVAECAHIGFLAAYPGKAVDVKLAIKEHFGVKE